MPESVRTFLLLVVLPLSIVAGVTVAVDWPVSGKASVSRSVGKAKVKAKAQRHKAPRHGRNR